MNGGNVNCCTDQFFEDFENHIRTLALHSHIHIEFSSHETVVAENFWGET